MLSNDLINSFIRTYLDYIRPLKSMNSHCITLVGETLDYLKLVYCFFMAHMISFTEVFNCMNYTGFAEMVTYHGGF